MERWLAARPTAARSGLMTLAIILAACAGPNPRDGSLYLALGETEGIDRIVEELLDRAHEDPRITQHFDPMNRDYLHDRLVEFVCAETGGPCEYTGLSMEEAHAGLQLFHREFDAFVEDLILAMEQLDVDVRAQNGLLAVFAPLRGDIVDK